MAWFLFDCYEVRPCVQTILNILRRHGWSRKKASKAATQRNEALRADYLASRLNWPVERLVFVDESTCCARTGDRKYGWSPIGQSCFTTQYLDRSQRFSVLPALTIGGYLKDPLICRGGVTQEAFEEWFEGVMVPQLTPGAIVVLDNAGIHKGPRFIEICRWYGLRVEFLPPYSPDFNPIELSSNVLKQWVKRHIGELPDHQDFGSFMRYAVERVGSGIGARGWFRRCGYCD
jgi:transposase